MEFRVNLDPETEALLRQQAASEGRPPEDLAREAIKEKLAGGPTRANSMSQQEWLERLRRAGERRRDRPSHIDDSRDSIYPDRAA